MSEIRIHRQKRRSLVMKRTPVGLVVFIPNWLKPDSPQVRQFIEEGMKKLGVPAPMVEQTSIDDLRALVALWAERLGVQPTRVQFRDMYQKWGSCSSKGNITLNTALCTIPRELAEYVVLHEVVHLRVLNHSKAFKALMSAHMPDWTAREDVLDNLLKRKSD
ncbi:MAG TPA: M48 family metallopeptidase [Phototrophicaceae bacterium]|nr:M48 family metallopeptidase [Phototrophicaceae bacterium]